MLRLIADSGSTKTDWTLLFTPNPLVSYEVVATFKTQGITPIYQTPADIRLILVNERLSQLSAFPRAKLVDSKALENNFMQHIPCTYRQAGAQRGTLAQERRGV